MNLADTLSYLSSFYFFPLLSIHRKTEGDLKIFTVDKELKVLYRNKSLDLLIIYEQFVFQEYKDVGIQDGDIVIEIGGHIGTSALDYSQRIGRTGKVYTFEPMRDSYDILIKNLKYNKIQNVEAFNLAISPEKDAKKIELYTHPYNTASHSVHPVEVKTSEKLVFEAVNLEEFLKEKQITSTNILHIDVEGAEYDFFRNLDVKLLSKFREIVLEYHDKLVKDTSHQEIVEKLKKAGLKISKNLSLLYLKY